MRLLTLMTMWFCLSVQANEELFVIDSGDVILIKVYNENDLTVRAKVGKKGILKIPLVGDVKVSGKTTQELSHQLELAFLDGYLVNPSVSVTVESYRPFYIRGAVKKPGSYPFEFNLTVDQALAVAGGLKDRASSKNWYVIRGPQKQRIKATKETNVYPGDIIEIEESLF